MPGSDDQQCAWISPEVAPSPAMQTAGSTCIAFTDQDGVASGSVRQSMQKGNEESCSRRSVGAGGAGCFVQGAQRQPVRGECVIQRLDSRKPGGIRLDRCVLLRRSFQRRDPLP